ncbi:galactose-binding domain-containing protein [Cohnella nanjingensis]|uniref:Discoidin domain-containing protein n=1 Tax=Cohnella nanjingensis TaxID=1387779 RepID=A0A7X0VIW9_9BACL|nr:discoidin domain-containing protein [Cohnella nanjingensis]MBB6674963.1 discoidin domain-containing protein [Cohnella nanjingensis]
MAAILLLTGVASWPKAHAEPLVNLAAGKPATSGYAGFAGGGALTNGVKSSAGYASVSSGLQWVQIDLGKRYDVNKVKFWHYFADGRTYRDVIVQLSDDPSFRSGVTTVFNNDRDNSAGFGQGKDMQYAETEAGMRVRFPTVGARYVRLYAGGSSANRYNHYVEIEVWGTASSGKPEGGGPQAKRAMFDDFSYADARDAKLGQHGWTLRGYAGGPGPKGTSWAPEQVTFVNDPANAGNRLARLQASTDGTGKGTRQAEIFTAATKYREGTYAARVRFTDAPVSGPDGDGIVQTFFTISPMARDDDPKYSELDFELLPNGGWGVAKPALWHTSWYTYRNEPWRQDTAQDHHPGSYAGWHELVMTVADKQIVYYLDGKRLSAHGGKYYPRQDMAIHFNLWFLPDGLLDTAKKRSYVMDVDWVYHAQDAALTPAQVEAAVRQYRADRVTFVDDVTAKK